MVLCYFGDGAVGQGAFHEAVNMGAIWSLPIVYFCENNRYAMSTSVDYAFNVEHLAAFAQSYGLPSVTINGNDYGAVRSATEEAVARARDGGGPTLIEAETYRHYGHSKSDDCFYRPDDEEAQWHARDPVDHIGVLLRERELIDHDGDRKVREDVAQEVEQAVEFAREASPPDAGTVDEGLWASEVMP